LPKSSSATLVPSSATDQYLRKCGALDPLALRFPLADEDHMACGLPSPNLQRIAQSERRWKTDQVRRLTVLRGFRDLSSTKSVARMRYRVSWTESLCAMAAGRNCPSTQSRTISTSVDRVILPQKMMLQRAKGTYEAVTMQQARARNPLISKPYAGVGCQTM
jgi:hypothetical protein